MASRKRKGYERQLWIGIAGSGVAATLLVNATDINVKNPLQKTSTTTRGDSLSVPITTESVTQRGFEATCTMLAEDDDAALIALTDAAENGTPVCMKALRYPGSGSKGFLGDVNVEIEEDGTLTGGNEIKFKFTANNDAGVAPELDHQF